MGLDLVAPSNQHPRLWVHAIRWGGRRVLFESHAQVVAMTTIAQNSRQLHVSTGKSRGSFPGKAMDSLVAIG